MNDEEKKTVQNRLHSKWVWIGIIGQIVTIVTIFNPDIAAPIKTLLTSICEMATLVGILNNPTDKENW